MAEKEKNRADDKATEAIHSARLATTERDKAQQALRLARKNLYLSNLHLADIAWKAGRYGKVREILESLVPGEGERSSRFGWRYLWKECHRELQTFKGGQVWAYSPDGTRLAVCSGNKIAVLDVTTGKERISWQRHKGYVTGVSFSHDGRRLRRALASTSLFSYGICRNKS